MSDIPEWAIERVKELMRGRVSYAEQFARYIAEHEEPPVDPLAELIAEAAFEALGETWERSGYLKFATELRKRGVTVQS